MAAATINGQSVPLSYELQNGDVVSIITSDEQSTAGGGGAVTGGVLSAANGSRLAESQRSSGTPAKKLAKEE